MNPYRTDPYTIRIEVTQEDIDTGYPCEHTVCPIARAIHRTIPEATFVSVTLAEIEVRAPGLPIYWKLPDQAMTWIHAFDRRQEEIATLYPVEPFVFDMVADV